MEFRNILFWMAVVIVAWLGLRNLITILIGSSQIGPLRPGQRICHATELVLYWAACLFAIFTHTWWPLAVGVIAGFFFRHSVIRSGERAHEREIEMLFAVRTNNIDDLRNSIKLGADVNWQDSKIEGETALHAAVRKANLEIVNFLLQTGANINSKNHSGLTPLHVAAYCGEREIVNTLIEKGAEVNAKAKDGITPLHAAASMGNGKTIELLIERGAGVHAKTSTDGLTPKDFASREGHKTVADLLSKY
jgi:hypothetical protein